MNFKLISKRMATHWDDGDLKSEYTLVFKHENGDDCPQIVTFAVKEEIYKNYAIGKIYSL